MTERPSAPVRVRLRPDLVATPIDTPRGRQWHVKDPISLRFYQFDAREFGLLQMLDGESTIDTLLARYHREFAPRHLSARQLLFFIDEARRNGLLILNRPPADLAPDEEDAPPTKSGPVQRWLGRLNVLSLRLPGLDPDAFLDATYPLVRWAFSRTALVAGGLLIVSALALVLLRFDQFLDRLPERAAFFTPQSALWLAGALAITKILHELAHAYACKHFGGECHELGIMFLVFVPCLYCNVTDSWLMASRRERMGITAAGMWTELVLAAAATWVWWMAVDGPVRMAALSVMIVCSLSTVLLNGNPLMRYDGYYLFSDLVRVPNLGAEASRVLNDLWRRWGLGLIESSPPRSLPRRLLSVYGVASFIYRVFLCGAILLAIHSLGKTYRLQVLAWLVTFVSLGSLIVPMLDAATRPLRTRRDRRRIQPAQAAVTLTLLGLLAGGLMLLPVPHRLYAPFVMEAEGAERLFVAVPGDLVSALPPGTTVSAGELVGRLENLSLHQQRESLTARRELLRSQLSNLEAVRRDDDVAAARIPATREAIADVEQQLEDLNRNLARLELRAGRNGQVLPPPNVAERPRTREQLPTWSGSPLDPVNIGAFLESGTPFCLVGDPAALSATVLVSQPDLPRVRPDQPVRLLLDGLSDRLLSGRVTEVSRVPVENLPREIAALHKVAVAPESTSEARPLEPVYRVRVRLDEPAPTPLLCWSTGEARIQLSPEPLAYRLWRGAQRTFRFAL